MPLALLADSRCFLVLTRCKAILSLQLDSKWSNSGQLFKALIRVIQPCSHLLPLTLPPQGLDWAALAARKIPAPFRPQIRSELDVGNFAEEFTRLEPVYSPAGSPPPGDSRIFQVSGNSPDPDGGDAGHYCLLQFCWQSHSTVPGSCWGPSSTDNSSS